MADLFALIPVHALWLSAAVALLAGFVKGVVGFAMPLIMISTLSTFLPPEIALAGLILPTLVTNAMQALRQGPRAALASMRRFRGFLIAGGVMLMISAQFVTVLPVAVLLAIIGLPIAVFALLQLAGWRPRLPAGGHPRLELAVGAFAGFIGGLSAVWGPPLVTYLTAIGTEKREQMRVQGVVYGLGAVLLVFAHLGSGVITATTALFSALLLPPAILGMGIGGLVQDRIDQAAFRKATLLVLLVAALNLLRRALLG
ncbi:sulfite exporter TauE/SafE family protein [Thalassococcus sp. CAU 1522]|uniref:Probable membrane transporter protein n=1 Tax=Thalassococcus arenae TaxID=2851652 RepID=A0ABS6N4B0_9RHOB|nr:sulfite exporter TauE/SafE family protein [Thalassococcus arenae]MBV2358856.1 sulfite exporter TauE/SafE family protein [Thalassococcus arenae]